MRTLTACCGSHEINAALASGWVVPSTVPAPAHFARQHRVRDRADLLVLALALLILVGDYLRLPHLLYHFADHMGPLQMRASDMNGIAVPHQ